MNATRRFICLLAGAHLVLVGLGASSQVGRLGQGPVARSVQWYGAMTGADAGFNFFAPQVGSEMRVRFDLSDDTGRVWADELTADANQEVRLRIGSMTGLFPAEPEAEPVRLDLAASWAATMFGRHPDAHRVVVWVELYDVPSMADYRAGERPAWVPVYSATFTLASSS